MQPDRTRNAPDDSRLRVGYFLGTDGDYGGAGRILWNILRHADLIGIEPVAVLSHLGPGVAELEARGIPWTVWSAANQGVTAAAARALRFPNFVQGHRMHLVHCLVGVFGWWAWELRAVRRTGCPVIVHAQRPLSPQSAYLRYASAAIACSAYLAGRIRSVAPVHAIHDLVDAARMRGGRSLRRELGIPSATKVVVFVGRPRTAKGIGLFLEVAAAGLLPSTRFLISIQRGNRLPDTWDDEALHARACKVPNVHLPGNVEQIADVYASADALLLPFRGDECCPAVLGEAAVAGVPVVTSGAVSVREYVHDELSGIHVAEPSIETLAQALARLLEDCFGRDHRSRTAAWGRKRSVERPAAALGSLYTALGSDVTRTTAAY